MADFIANQLGLGAVWETIQALGGNSVSQIIEEGLQLIVAGKDKMAQAQVIFAQLVSALKDHGVVTLQAATQMVQNAIKQVAELLSNLE